MGDAGGRQAQAAACLLRRPMRAYTVRIVANRIEEENPWPSAPS
jgi:hypothetical protein